MKLITFVNIRNI